MSPLFWVIVVKYVNLIRLFLCDDAELSIRAKHFCALTSTESMAKITFQRNGFKLPPVASAGVRSKAVLLSLLIHCLLLLPWFVAFYLCLILVWVCNACTLCPF